MKGDFVEKEIQNRIQLLRSAARSEQRYQNCYEEFMKAERDFLEMIPQLTEEQQDCLWRFVNLSNDVDNLLLEFACHYLAL